MLYLLRHLAINKVTGQFIVGIEDWTGSIIWWAVQGKVTTPLSRTASSKLFQ